MTFKGGAGVLPRPCRERAQCAVLVALSGAFALGGAAPMSSPPVPGVEGRGALPVARAGLVSYNYFAQVSAFNGLKRGSEGLLFVLLLQLQPSLLRSRLDEGVREG